MKYLIKCKKAGRFAVYNSSSLRGENNKNIDANTVILGYSENSEAISSNHDFTIEYVSEKDAYYIKSATGENLYVYAVNTGDEDSNVGVKSFESPDESCLWTITYNGKENKDDQVYGGFNIKPKNGSNGWNCRGANSSHQIGQWSSNNTDDNLWCFIPAELTSGYYTLKNCATDRYTNYFNDFTYSSNPNGYTMGSSTLPETLPNGYIWHVSSNGKGVLTVANGQGGDAIKTEDGLTTSTLTVMAYTNGGYCFDSFLNASKDKYVGVYLKMTTWLDGGVAHADNLWNFNTIDGFDEANIYNVVVNNAAGYVTYNTTSEAAKNGGFFYLTSTPQTSDFTAATLELYNSSISISDHTITVNYTVNENGLKEKAASVETEILSKTGVGYPTESSSEHAALAQAINNAKAATADNADALNAALDAAVLAYKNTTSNIQMPEDGKAYRVAYLYNDGVKQYLYWNGSRIAANQDDQIADKNTSIFICHEMDGKYLFATNLGTYLSWMDNNNTSISYNTQGVTDSYVGQNVWTVEPADANTGGGSISATRADFFGRMQMKALNKNGDAYYYLNTRHAGATKDADFIAGWAGSKYYDSNNGRPRSHTFVFEEVTYPNEVKFASTNGKVTGADYVATFSAPFATIIPEGVTAYIVKTEGTTATLTPIEGAQAIPARTGVILTSTDGATARMVPAADETTATVADNELGNSAGAALELTAESGYILGQRDGQIAFYHTADGTLPMNRAYLRKSADQSVQSIQMVFTPATGIGEATTTINTVNVPLYDLAGRRVMKPAKGGVYIQNGRKFIVK